MKITKKQLKQIIKEEIEMVLDEKWESQHAAMARYARQAARGQAGKSQPPGSDRPTSAREEPEPEEKEEDIPEDEKPRLRQNYDGSYYYSSDKEEMEKKRTIYRERLKRD